jgi:hypothetical protein
MTSDVIVHRIHGIIIIMNGIKHVVMMITILINSTVFQSNNVELNIKIIATVKQITMSCMF